MISASGVSPRGTVPRMAAILSASVRKQEFLAFVDTKAEMMDYGFCVGEKDGTYTVLSQTTNQPVEVQSDTIVSAHVVEIPDHIRAAITPRKAPVRAAGEGASDMIEYYKRAYNFAPDYVEQVIKQIEQMSAI